MCDLCDRYRAQRDTAVKARDAIMDGAIKVQEENKRLRDSIRRHSRQINMLEAQLGGAHPDLAHAQYRDPLHG